ncbi:MAG: hypothetical protein KAR08_01475 [Candidatus Heimdallarchaeota archaeon]|nr:hypothetical protein [Candidatus Heimdallarchaeota archaeon]
MRKIKFDIKKMKKKQMVFLVIGLIIGLMVGGLALSTVLGEGQYQSNIVGLKVGRSTALQGAFVFDYIDYTSTDSLLPRTTDYSTWNPDRALINYASHSIDKYSWNIDCDTATYGMPNIIASIGDESYPCDNQGNPISEYDNDYVEIKQVINGVDYVHKLYRSFVGTQLTIIVAGGMDISKHHDILGDWIGQGSLAETPSTYDAKDTRNTDQSFLGNGVEFSFVLRNSLKDLVLIETEPELGDTDFKGEGFLWSKIGSVDNNIENTQGWWYRGDFSGDVIARQIVMYPTVEDALLGQKQLADTTIEQVLYEDTISSEIFTKYSFEVKLGCNFEVDGLLGTEWAVYEEANNGMAIQGWQVTLNLVSAVFTAYSLDNSDGSVPLVNIVNPWQDLAIIYNDLWADFMTNMKFFFGSDFGKIIKWVLVGLVAVGVGYVGIKFLPFAIKMGKVKRKTSQMMGSISEKASGFKERLGNLKPKKKGRR